MTDTAVDELVAKLRKRRKIRTGDPELGPLMGELLNPDGPEAADRIVSLSLRVRELRDVLADIVDYRGGADTALADQYVMDRAIDAIANARTTLSDNSGGNNG